MVLVSLLLTLNILPCSSVFIVYFELVNDSWDTILRFTSDSKSFHIWMKFSKLSLTRQTPTPRNGQIRSNNLSANQTIFRQQSTNCLSLFDYFVGLVLKGLMWAIFKQDFKTDMMHYYKNNFTRTQAKSDSRQVSLSCLRIPCIQVSILIK